MTRNVDRFVDPVTLKNSSAQVATHGMQLVSGSALSILIGRLWGAELLGEYSVVIAFATMFAFAADAGLSNMLLPELAAKPEERARLVGLSLLWTTISSIIAIPLMGLAAYATGYSPDLAVAIAMGGLWMGIGALSAILRGAFYAAEKMAFETATVLIERSSALAFCSVIVMYTRSLPLFVAGLIGSRILKFCLGYFLFRVHLGDVTLAAPRRAMTQLVQKSIPFGLNSAASAIYIHSDVLVLSLWRPAMEVGFYQVASSLVVPLTAVATAVINAILPRLVVARVAGDQARFRRLARHTMFSLTVFGLIIAAIWLTFAETLIQVLYGAALLRAAPALQILAMIIPLRFVNNSIGAVLTASGHQVKRTRSVVLVAILNLSLNFLIVPRYGFLGASATTLLSELALTGLLVGAMGRQWPKAIKHVLRMVGRNLAGPFRC